jgi:hypothetical protein
MTVERACQHLTNFTAGHETRADLLGVERFAYPDQHVESDNRLAWFLGALGRSCDPDQTLYVHLVRDPGEVAASFARRWDQPFRASLVRAFGHGVVMRGADWPEEERTRVARFLVDTVNDNIASFVATQPRTMRGDITDAAGWFPELWERIDGQGDLPGALRELGTRHNETRLASSPGSGAG